MMKKDDWSQALDQLMSFLGVASYGATLHKAVCDYHGRPHNKNLYLALKCGGCTSKIYFAIKKLNAAMFQEYSDLPSVQCPKCRHHGDHRFDAIVHDPGNLA